MKFRFLSPVLSVLQWLVMLSLQFAVFPPLFQNDLLMHMNIVVYIDYNFNFRPFPASLICLSSCIYKNLGFNAFLFLVNVMGEM